MAKAKKSTRKIRRKSVSLRTFPDISRVRAAGTILLAIILGLAFGKLFLAH